VIQLLQVIALNRVLVLGVALPSANSDVLYRLQKQGRSRHDGEFGA
jgi:hypothetical protein